MKKILTILTMIASLTFTSCEDFPKQRKVARGQQNFWILISKVQRSRSIYYWLLPGHYFWRMVEYQHSMVAFPRCVVMTVGWAIPAKVKVTIFL